MKLYYGDHYGTKISIQFLKKYDYLALPSTQVHPFNKDIPSPTAINGDQMETYHQWMDIVVLASILGLPTISVPVGFSRRVSL